MIRDSSQTSARLDTEQTTEEAHLRRIFIRAQMSDFVREPLLMARADGVHYWDVNGKQYLDALAGIYVANVGHNNRRVIEEIQQQLDTLSFSPPMHGSTQARGSQRGGERSSLCGP